MTRRFGESIHAGKINIDEAEMDPSNLLKMCENLMIDLDQEHQNVKINKYKLAMDPRRLTTKQK